MDSHTKFSSRHKVGCAPPRHRKLRRAASKSAVFIRARNELSFGTAYIVLNSAYVSVLPHFSSLTADQISVPRKSLFHHTAPPPAKYLLQVSKLMEYELVI